MAVIVSRGAQFAMPVETQGATPSQCSGQNDLSSKIYQDYLTKKRSMLMRAHVRNTLVGTQLLQSLVTILICSLGHTNSASFTSNRAVDRQGTAKPTWTQSNSDIDELGQATFQQYPLTTISDSFRRITN